MSRRLHLGLLALVVARPGLGQERSAVFRGQVIDSVTGRPLGGAVVFLTGIGTGASHRAATGDSGFFRAEGLRTGRYAIAVRGLGYGARFDTLNIAGEVVRRYPLAVVRSCMGECPADSARMQVARARRAAWTCTTDPTEVAEQRLWWARALASGPISDPGASGPEVDSLHRAIRHVTDRDVCRRVGGVFNVWGDWWTPSPRCSPWGQSADLPAQGALASSSRDAIA
ncbi:MAG: carboxypeptidase-like regulatory domain-containing protein [Gemmatimonadales bacterium]